LAAIVRARPMSATPETPGRFAWQPLTPAGVAAFANASFRRLAAITAVVLLVLGLSLAFFVATAWLPVIDRSLAELPQGILLHQERLTFLNPQPRMLAEGPALSLALTPGRSVGLGSLSDVEIEFGDRHIFICSLLGCLVAPYPGTAEPVALERMEVQSWWGAWRPAIWFGLTLAALIPAVVAWLFQATLYAVPLWMIAFFKDRNLNLPGAWRLAAAAVLPGMLFLSIAIVSYGLQVLDLVRFLACITVHLLVIWTFAVAAVFRLPRYVVPGLEGRSNPFTPPEEDAPAPASANPFAAPQSPVPQVPHPPDVRDPAPQETPDAPEGTEPGAQPHSRRGQGVE
jgi:hypothetical protein